MATAAQLEANRLNALQSTGPRTAEGKARSSRNARRDGLFVSVASFSPLEREVYQEFLAESIERWETVTEEERRLSAEIALVDFRRGRARALEAAWYAQRVEELREKEGLPVELTYEQALRLQARAFHEDCHGAQALSRLFRWERAFTRDFERLILQLHALILQRQAAFSKTNPVPRQTSENPAPAAPETRLAAPSVSPARVAVPRNAPCPCGSSLKFKRCCGKNAPPQLFPSAQAA